MLKSSFWRWSIPTSRGEKASWRFASRLGDHQRNSRETLWHCQEGKDMIPAYTFRHPDFRKQTICFRKPTNQAMPRSQLDVSHASIPAWRSRPIISADLRGGDPLLRLHGNLNATAWEDHHGGFSALRSLQVHRGSGGWGSAAAVLSEKEALMPLPGTRSLHGPLEETLWSQQSQVWNARCGDGISTAVL